MFKVFNMGIGMIVICEHELSVNDDFILLGSTEMGIKGVDLI